MPSLINLKTHKDPRGSLSVVEDEIGFSIKRVFYIYDVSMRRGGHGHFKARTALIALGGKIEVSGQTPQSDFTYSLETPAQCLVLDPEDWHEMDFTRGSILLALSSEPYDKADYFFDKYRP